MADCRCDEVCSFRWLMLVAVAMVLSPAGCAVWEGRLDDDYSQSVDRRIAGIDQFNIADESIVEPATVEEKLEGLLTQRQPIGDERNTDDDDSSSGEDDDSDDSEAGPPKSRSFSVADVRSAVLENNLDLAVIMLDPTIAATKITEEQAKFDATIAANIAYKREDLPRLDNDFVEFTSENDALDKEVVKLTDVEQQKEKLSFDIGIGGKLPTGGKFKVAQMFDESNKLEPQRFEQYVTALKFSFSQPLLRDAGVDVNVASIRLARLDERAKSATTKLKAIHTLAKAEKAYWKLYTARRVLDVREQQYDLAFRNLDLVRQRANQGLSPEIEVIRAEVGVANRLESLFIAETDTRLTQRNLKMMLNLSDVDLNSVTELITTTEPQLVLFDLDGERLVAAATSNRMELLELELDLAADAIRINFAENQVLPLFDLDFEYGVLERGQGFSNTWQGMWDFDNQTLGIGGRLEIPVTNEKRKSKLRRAILTRMQRLATQERREMLIRQEVYDALDVFHQNWQRVLAARQNVIVSGVNYEAELKQFDLGLRTMREVFEALTQLGEAQVKEVKAIVSYQFSQIDLAFATGTLLGYSRVGLEPLPFEINSETDALDVLP